MFAAERDPGVLACQVAVLDEGHAPDARGQADAVDAPGGDRGGDGDIPAAAGAERAGNGERILDAFRQHQVARCTGGPAHGAGEQPAAGALRVRDRGLPPVIGEEYPLQALQRAVQRADRREQRRQLAFLAVHLHPDIGAETEACGAGVLQGEPAGGQIAPGRVVGPDRLRARQHPFQTLLRIGCAVLPAGPAPGALIFRQGEEAARLVGRLSDGVAVAHGADQVEGPAPVLRVRPVPPVSAPAPGQVHPQRRALLAGRAAHLPVIAVPAAVRKVVPADRLDIGRQHGGQVLQAVGRRIGGHDTASLLPGPPEAPSGRPEAVAGAALRAALRTAGSCRVPGRAGRARS